MKVKIKDLGIPLEIKSKGVEIDVSDNQDKHVGDLYVTMTNLIWCKGRTTRAKGTKVSWDNFMKVMQHLPQVKKLIKKL